jgi:hypothetical protein
LATALGSDANFSTTIANLIATKQTKITTFSSPILYSNNTLSFDSAVNNLTNYCNKTTSDNNISFIIDTTNIIWFKLADVTNILEYKSLNHDIEKNSDEDAIKHYYDYGRFENRLYSYNQFNIEEYKDKKPFLKNYSNDEIIEYYYYHGRYEIKK